ncbi:hypothetical protein E2N92_06080 [Methanofollis formosanus]|uniref:Uncharacterized protein n=1 Tax=Methanofollis formosanus TaxID=299308 RepID=A0A8G1A044_9EURY|nr:hypothetical protein [Methanofollis formosanus]QYZ79024.1 hypothetical protein E2N92_06080 [Methanofollis formosanus]
MDMKINPLVLLFFSVIAVVLTVGCTDSSLSEGDTHLQILDGGAENQSISSIDIQPGNTPDTTTPPLPSAPLPEPAYAIGDVISYEQDSDVAEVILDYDSQNDAYQTDVIFKWDEYDTGEYGWYPHSAPAGTWGYRLERNDSSWTDRTCMEKSYPYVLGHADPIALREDYD